MVTAKGKAPKVLKVALDVTKQESVESAAVEVEKAFGRLDILIHNAGVSGNLALIADTDPLDWWNTWTTNVRDPYLVTHSFFPLLLKGGDKQIIYVGSVGSFLKFSGVSAY